MDFNQLIIGVVAGIIVSVLSALFAWSRGYILISLKRFSLFHRLIAAGLSNFYVSRNDYALYREEGGELTDYLRSAQKSIKICGYWIAQGTELEKVNDVVMELIKERNVDVTIALIDPSASYLPELATYLDSPEDEIKRRIKDAIRKFCKSGEELLSKAEKNKFTLKTYRTLPIASVIMIDIDDSTNGKIQVDIKPYKAPRINSFTFELRGQERPLYQLCKKCWLQLINDAEPVKCERDED